jgi:tRNA threonylcarbamoyladenosine biosynthesis protein TsaE
MTFRADNDSRRRWSRWIQAHGDELARLGLPLPHFRSEQNWWYFLEHGYTTQFKIDWLSPEHVRGLYELLRRQPDAGMRRSSLFQMLDYRFMHSSLALESRHEGETVALGRVIAATLQPGDVLTLNGELGAGKTRLVQGIAAALGCRDQLVNSPTFVMIQEYDGPLRLYHIDVYRLRDSDEFLEIGGDEVLAAGGACVIEWADRVADVLPADVLRVEIDVTGEESRTFRLIAGGKRSAELLEAVQRALGRVKG